MIGNAVGSLVYNHLGLILGFSFSYTIAIIGTIFLIIYWQNINLILIFIMLAKFGTCCAFNMSFISSVELIPSILATSAFGFSNVVARVVTILSPLIAEIDPPLPLKINVCVTIFAILVAQFTITKKNQQKYFWDASSAPGRITSLSQNLHSIKGLKALFLKSLT